MTRPHTTSLAIDAGTSSVRAIVFDQEAHILACQQRELSTRHEPGGVVRQSPAEIIGAVLDCVRTVVDQVAVPIDVVGITNQRESFCLLDTASRQPVTDIFSWQDRSTAPWCREMALGGHDSYVKEVTGLPIDPYFSAPKVVKALEKLGLSSSSTRSVTFATIDTLIVLALTDGRHLVTDPSNASRTLLFDTEKLQFSDELLEQFGIRSLRLPEVVPSISSGLPCMTPVVPRLDGVPIAGILGDQQASLLGQGCTSIGMAKNTYGTGSFLLAHQGETRPRDHGPLLSSIAWTDETGRCDYVLEGAVYATGSILRWLRDEVGLISSYSEVDALLGAPRHDDLTFVPTFEGAGAPWNIPEMRAAILGLGAATTASDIVHATVDAIAHQCADVIDEMNRVGVAPITHLRVDGGASVIDELCQRQADFSRCEVERSSISESTAFGAAVAALIGIGALSSWEEIPSLNPIAHRFEPAPSLAGPRTARATWHHRFGRVADLYRA
ncbi:MAG: FGGY family carbohydrate kinase [Acidimicrobiales bacterium]